MDDRKIVLGLDIGVGSVGWGLIDKDSGNIIDKGVRLFSEADPENNLKRRNFRHIRRSLRRKEFRLYRAKRVLMKMGLIDSIEFEPLNNPYEIRCKGLRQKLNNQELATALLNLIKRNGFRYDIADDDESGTKTIKEEYLCEHQLIELKENGRIRGINNKYHFSLYDKEFRKLCEAQKIKDDDFDKLYFLFKTRRDYSEGPGGPNSPTSYGRYLTLGTDPINLIDKMRGHCSIYKEELRAPKICPSSELFNLLNDLNNLTIDGNHINQEKKAEIIENFILPKGKITLKQVENVLGKSIQSIDGFRINAKGDPLLSEVKSIQKIREAVKKEGLTDFEIDNFDDLDMLDEIFDVLTKEKSIESRIENLRKLNISKLNEMYISAFSKIKGISEYHSLSLKALRQLIGEMLVTSKNSQQIIVTFEKEDNDSELLKLPDDAIISPVVKKSVNQTFKIIKAIIKKYGCLNTVMIEMTRDKNSKEEQKRINDSLKNNEKKKEMVLELIGKYIQEPTRELIDKVLYYLEQDGKSVYSGKPIDLNDLIVNPQKFEIDHVIPYSISLDDSKANKVLVYANENQIKGQRTPYQIMVMNTCGLCDFSTFEAYVRTNNNFSRRKKENLLNKKNIYAGDVREEFINRNLSDTRYITSLVLNSLKRYFRKENIDTKVHVVNGNLTHKLRVTCGIPKRRNMYCHHAVDALLIASMLKSKYLERAFDNNLHDQEDGGLYLNQTDKEILSPIAETVAAQIKELDPIKDFKFSYKIDTKANRSIADQTIYGTRIIDGEMYVIKKYKNIYDKEGEKIAEMIKTGKGLEKLLIVKNDPNTFALLQKIVASYPKEKNPFLQYKNEHGIIHKYSVKNKATPEVISLKYVEGFNIHLNLSSKYKKNKDNNGKATIKLQLSPYRMDLYFSKEKGYKFVTIRYADVKTKGTVKLIDKCWYEEQKQKLSIDNNYKFVNSFYRGDLMERTTDDGVFLDVFIAVNNPKNNVIESNYYGQDTLKIDNNGVFKKFQYMVTLGKKNKTIKKISSDILGNLYYVKNERLKLEW